jgi:hypothetical protein
MASDKSFMDYVVEQMENAARIISAIHADNPRRSINYFFGIVRGRFGVPEGVKVE